MDALIQLGLGGGALALLYLFGKQFVGPLVAAHIRTLESVVKMIEEVTRTLSLIQAGLDGDRTDARRRHSEVLDRLGDR